MVKTKTIFLFFYFLSVLFSFPVFSALNPVRDEKHRNSDIKNIDIVPMSAIVSQTSQDIEELKQEIERLCDNFHILLFNQIDLFHNMQRFQSKEELKREKYKKKRKT